MISYLKNLSLINLSEKYQLSRKKVCYSISTDFLGFVKEFWPTIHRGELVPIDFMYVSGTESSIESGTVYAGTLAELIHHAGGLAL